MSWGSIVGQALAVRLLRQAVSAGKVAHAYLFVGPEGVGKRTVALELIKALNCQHPGPDGSACDCCSSCRRISPEAVLHPDVITVAPDGRIIKTDQIRELREEMYARPTEGRVRVAVIDGADRMNAESGNRLLKLLEEPPAHAVLILLTSNLSGVLPTLISRCQVINFPPLSSDDVTGLLVGKLGLDQDRAHLMASLSGGSVGRARRMAEDEALLARREEACTLLEQLPRLDDLMLLGHAEALDKAREHLEDWLDLTTALLRDGLLVAEGAQNTLLINRDMLRRVEGLADRYGAPALLALLEIVTGTRSNLQKNANTRLTLDLMVLHLGDIGRAAESST